MPLSTLSNVSAVILASGVGSRLGDLTNTTPKPLLQFGGHPYLKYLLDWLTAQGVDDIIITAATHAGQIEHFVKNLGPDFQQKVRVVVEDTLKNTAESTRFGLSFVKNKESLIMTADTIWEVSLSDMYDYHLANHSLCTAMIFTKPKTNLAHVVPLVKINPSGKVVSMNYSSDEKDGNTNLASGATAGLYIVDVVAMLGAIKRQDESIERESMSRLIPNVYAYKNEGLLLDYGSKDSYLYLKNNPDIIQKYYSANITA